MDPKDEKLANQLLDGYPIKIYASTDGKNTVEVSFNTKVGKEEALGILKQTKYLYDWLKENMGTKATIWAQTPKTEAKEVKEETKETTEKSEDRPDWCKMHNMPMYEKEGKYGKFYSHGNKELGYCKGNGYKVGRPTRS